MPRPYAARARPHGELPRQSDHDTSEQVGVVIVAAGESRRMSGVDKIFTQVHGLPLIAHTIEVFEASPLVRALVLVLSSDKVELGLDLVRSRGWHKVTAVCQGGPRRQDSVRLGLERLPECSWVAVHDGARPCVEPELLLCGVKAARETGAAVAAVPSRDTVKVVSSHGFVESTPPRDTLWIVQTPQVFRYDLLLEAHREFQETVTDDATMVEGLGHKVKVFQGSYSNLKVTTPEDLIMAESLLKTRQECKGH